MCHGRLGFSRDPSKEETRPLPLLFRLLPPVQSILNSKKASSPRVPILGHRFYPKAKSLEKYE
jgi:hypothetical protein